jgi:hypothetical protein
LTADFQASVTVEPWIGQNGYGDDTWDIPVTHQALVDRTVKQRYTSSGKLVVTIAKLTFLNLIAENGAAGRREPIDPRDKITLDDGTTAPIVDIPMFENPATQAPFLVEVTLGWAAK